MVRNASNLNLHELTANHDRTGGPLNAEFIVSIANGDLLIFTFDAILGLADLSNALIAP